MPSSRRSPTIGRCADRRRGAPDGSGRRARRAGGRAARRPLDSAPRRNPPSSCPPSHTESPERWSSCARAPSSETWMAKPSRSEIAATTIPGACASPSFQPCGTPSRNGRVSPPWNGCTSQLAGLVAGLVLEPEDAFAVEARNRVDQPDRMVRDLPARAGVHVERVDLPAAGLVRRVDRASGSRRRPLREVRQGCTEALLPREACSSAARLPRSRVA